MKLNRRGLMQALAAAPVALKEAAQKMRLETGGQNAVIGYGAPNGTDAASIENDLKFYRTRLFELDDDLAKEERAETATAHFGRVLDSDIASFRSMSPAAAYAIQKERAVARAYEHERRQLNRNITRLPRRKMGL